MLTVEDFGVVSELELPVEFRAALSLALVAAILGLRWLLLLLIRRDTDILSDDQRWWMTTVRNAATGLVLLALVVVWAPEIQNFALSITAFAVALAIALKELILCVSGATWRGATQPFAVSDWVEIGGYSGEVVDETLLVTKLQEIDPVDFHVTGRTVSVPNSLLLTAPVVNHNFRKRFLLHHFDLTAETGVDVLAIRAALLEALEREFATYGEVATRYAAIIERAAGVKLPALEPVVKLSTTEFGNPVFRVRLFCPRERADEIQQAAALVFADAARKPGRTVAEAAE